MQPVAHAVIAAAGRGKRLGLGIPKCLVKINEYAVIDYQLHLVRDIPDVRIVVGYFESQVVEHVRRIRKDVLFVRNPNFRHTSTLQSLTMAVRGLRDNCLCMDGDMIIEEKSFAKFVASCTDGRPRIAVAEEITEDPVYAYTAESGSGLIVEGFGREKPSLHEWANVAFIPAGWLAFENTHFFIRLGKYLPLAAQIITRMEIDTPEDLASVETSLREVPDYCRAAKEEGSQQYAYKRTYSI